MSTLARPGDRSITDRTRAVRDLLRAAVPGTRFAVRPGVHGFPAVTWTDGPTDATVARLLREAGETAWTRRRYTAGFLAASFVHARRTGRRYHEKNEHFITTHFVFAELDAADLTEDDRAAAGALLTLAGSPGDRVYDPDRDSEHHDVADTLAACLFDHGDVLDAALA